jgi:hypothetical protein
MILNLSFVRVVVTGGVTSSVRTWWMRSSTAGAEALAVDDLGSNLRPSAEASVPPRKPDRCAYLTQIDVRISMKEPARRGGQRARVSERVLRRACSRRAPRADWLAGCAGWTW